MWTDKNAVMVHVQVALEMCMIFVLENWTLSFGHKKKDGKFKNDTNN